VDDFSFRRGRRWGTILVDLERHRLVDILPDRSSETLASWLTQHADVEVVSRDRSGEYADAARRAAPEAIHIADRFHLIKNLGDQGLAGVPAAFGEASVHTHSRASSPAADTSQAGPGDRPRAYQSRDAKPV
jgi:transposase